MAKVNAAGSALVYAGFLGGGGSDTGSGIAVDGSGNAYVTGQTESLSGTFPETAGVFQAQHAGGISDAYVAKVNATGSALVYAGFLGGLGDDGGNSIAVDGSGNAYVIGQTDSLAATFPETQVWAGAAQNRGGVDAFVAKVSPTGGVLGYAGFLGGAENDVGRSIAVDGVGNAYVTGETDSGHNSFPETSKVFQGTNGGATDAFVAKIFVENVRPTCSYVILSSPTRVQFTVRDLNSGLSTVQVTTATNILPPSIGFIVGTTLPVQFLAVKDNPALPSQVAILITDIAGNQASCPSP